MNDITLDIHYYDGTNLHETWQFNWDIMAYPEITLLFGHLFKGTIAALHCSDVGTVAWNGGRHIYIYIYILGFPYGDINPQYNGLQPYFTNGPTHNSEFLFRDTGCRLCNHIHWGLTTDSDLTICNSIYIYIYIAGTLTEHREGYTGFSATKYLVNKNNNTGGEFIPIDTTFYLFYIYLYSTTDCTIFHIEVE